jgi:ankyrin repeat protein
MQGEDDISNAKEDIVKQLLERKDIDVNVKDEEGKMGLIHAIIVAGGNRRAGNIVKKLLEREEIESTQKIKRELRHSCISVGMATERLLGNFWSGTISMSTLKIRRQ